MRSILSFALGVATLVTAQSLQQDLASFGIQAVFPSDSGYASASAAFNARYTYKPAVVTYPTSADQVAEVVKLGGQYHLSVVARSGGHSYIAAGTGGQDNAILVDLSKNKQITIDNAAGTAVIQTGNRLGDVASALNAQGRAMPHGSCAYVGIGGHGSFGGFGFQSRMWGLVLDVIQSATLVLPNGTVSTVSSSSYPELFWGVRGAAPSFGIVYSATYKTFAAPTNNLIYQLGWSATIAEASKIISAWQSFALTGNVPATFGGELNIGSGSSRGRIGIDLFCAFWGPAADFDALIQKFTSQVPSTVKVTSAAKKTTGSWLTALGVIMGSLSTTSPEDKDTFYAKSLLTPTATPMTDAAITAWVTYLANTGFDSDTSWFTQVELYGGPTSVINQVAVDSTSFARRDILFNLQLYASSSNFAPPYPADGFSFVDGMLNAIVNNMPSTWNYAMYTNYVEDRLSNWQQLYYGTHYTRLQTLKATVDPNNVFKFPTSIELPGSTNNGAKYIKPAQHTNLCLRPQSTTVANGVEVSFAPCSGVDISYYTWFTKTDGTAGSLKLVNKAADGTEWCVDAGSTPASGTRMKIWKCYDGLAAQTWVYNSATQQIKLNSANQCLDVVDGKYNDTGFTFLQTWTCTAGNTNQIYTITAT